MTTALNQNSLDLMKVSLVAHRTGVLRRNAAMIVSATFEDAGVSSSHTLDVVDESKVARGMEKLKVYPRMKRKKYVYEGCNRRTRLFD